MKSIDITDSDLRILSSCESFSNPEVYITKPCLLGFYVLPCWPLYFIHIINRYVFIKMSF